MLPVQFGCVGWPAGGQFAPFVPESGQASLEFLVWLKKLPTSFLVFSLVSVFLGSLSGWFSSTFFVVFFVP